MSSSVSPKPQRCSSEYCRIEACPGLRTKRSRSGQSGVAGSKSMIRVYSTCASGASAIAVPWWPDRAAWGASMDRPAIVATACCSMLEAVMALTLYPTNQRPVEAQSLCLGRKQRVRHGHDVAIGTDTTLGFDCPVLFEVDFAAHEAVVKLALGRG